MFRATRLVAVGGVLAALLAAGCDFSPTSPFEGFDGKGTRLSGKFLTGGSSSALTEFAQSEFEGITVEVDGDPAISTAVSSNGSFTLRGLPEGSFTLLFKKDGEVIGQMTFDEVMPNQEITIVVRLTDTGGVDLVEEKRNGIGHGDVEIEGKASDVQPSSEHPNKGMLKVRGYNIEARPGVTAIRKGNRRLTMSDIEDGDRVHVKGVWETPENGTQMVLAHEIKLQEEDDDEDGDAQCPFIEGGRVGERIELEGTVLSGTLGNFMLKVNGNRADGPVQVMGGTLECHGPKANPCVLDENDQVHVSGTLESCSASGAMVSAERIILQQKR